MHCDRVRDGARLRRRDERQRIQGACVAAPVIVFPAHNAQLQPPASASAVPLPRSLLAICFTLAQVKEMGEDGAGSREPGIASGETFIVPYPNRFLDFYYAANVEEAPGYEPPAPQEPAEPAEAPSSVNADDAWPLAGVKSEAERPPIFAFLTMESNQLVTSGPRRGHYTINYRCNVINETTGLPCCTKITCYAEGAGKAVASSNAYAHMRRLAKNGDKVSCVLPSSRACAVSVVLRDVLR